MLADLQNIISDKQSLVTGGAGTVVGTNVLDLRAVGTIPQGGSPIADFGRMFSYKLPDFLVQMTTSLTATGATTLDVQIVNSAATNLSSPTVLDTSRPIAKATLVAGYQFGVGRNLSGCILRYLGINYVVATSDVLTGNVWAGLATTRQTTPYITQ